MASSASHLPRRDRIAILTSIGGITALAWLYLAVAAAGMSDMDPAMPMGVHRWTPLDFALMFLMWTVMMVGMMLPTATPMALVYAAVARKAAQQGTPLAPTSVFVAGYLAIWTAFSLAATCAQWTLERAALLSPAMVSTSPALGALLLIGAGLYQFTPTKNACLSHCRSPAHFIAQHWRSGTVGAFQMGAIHGAYCLGCCWILMGLLFFGGVMSLLWIAGITVLVLAEKILPFGVWGGRLAGAVMIALGLAVLAR